MEKPTVKLCAACQKEFPAVDQQVKAHKDEINFSHGSCLRHSIEFYASAFPEGLSPQQLAAFKAKMEANPNPTPDLSQHPELVKAYSQGIFVRGQQMAALKERLQKLANIIKR